MTEFGFNFRASESYVTDPPGTTFVTSSTAYPTTVTIDSVNYTVGWNYNGGGSPSGSRNRSASVDARLAGLVQKSSTAAAFAVQLPASGIYKVRLALGDASFAKTVRTKIYDGDTLISTVADKVTCPGGSFVDASGIIRTAAEWPNDNQAVDFNFTSGIFVLVICSTPDALNAGGADDAVAHISLEAVGTGTSEDTLTAQNLKAQTSTTTPTLTQSHQLTPASIQAATTTTRATLAQVHTLASVSLISASNTTAGALTQAHTLAPTDLTSTATTSTPALAQIHTLAPASLTSQSSTTNTSLSDQSTVDNLTAVSLKSTSATSTPTFTQAHSLTASDTASQSSTSTPTLAQAHTLTPQGVTASTSTTTAALQSIAGQDSLAATDLTASTSTTTGTLAQVHVLTPQSLAAGTSTTTASITQVHGLAASNVISITSTTSPILRNASVVLATPINNTMATAIQTTYKATTVQAQRKAVTIQADYKVGVA